jgi:hypothetical protein
MGHAKFLRRVWRFFWRASVLSEGIPTNSFEGEIKMPRSKSCSIPIAAVFVLAACSQSASQPHGVNAGVVASGNACDRQLLSVADVGGILHEAITGTAPLKGDPQTCYFVTATTESQGGPELMVSLRPGLGSGTLKAWYDGTMGTTASKFAGVGDDAVWVSELKELDARKNELLCVVSIAGSGVIEHYEGLPQKLAGLCNKLFARVGS